jgi:hypothetical protein
VSDGLHFASVRQALPLSGSARKATKGWKLRAAVAPAAVLSLSLLASTAVHAVDGCLVLLCFAAPSWKSIPQCVPPIRQVLRDLAQGKAFPTCGMFGAGSSARHGWAHAPGNCPPQYTWVHETESGPIYTCDYTGAITVTIDGKQFTRTWWEMGGDTVTDFSPVAKSQLGTWDIRYDDDRAAWLRSRP